MTGEIHGIISREDAWRMWKPYGERVELDGNLDLETITPAEAVWIVAGADEDSQSHAYGYWYKKGDQRFWLDGLREAMGRSPVPEFLEFIGEMHEVQQLYAEEERNKAIENGGDLTRLLGRATMLLHEEGIFNKPETEKIQSWLTGPDGLPYMQYTPMSRLEYGRLSMITDKEEPALGSDNCTDFNLGIYRSGLNLYSGSIENKIHCRVHESVHGNFSGVEIYDITREDEWRSPHATAIGLFACEPTPKIVAGDDHTAVANGEVAEGWTDFVAREAMRVVPELGNPLEDAAGYGEWAKTIGTIKRDYPQLFRRITEVTLVEVVPENPTAKREAIAELHAYADKVLGATNSLVQLFQANGGRLLDVHTKGRDKLA